MESYEILRQRGGGGEGQALQEQGGRGGGLLVSLVFVVQAVSEVILLELPMAILLNATLLPWTGLYSSMSTGRQSIRLSRRCL